MNELDESLTTNQQKSNYLRFHKPFHVQIAKTSALCYTWISLGLYSEILGPTLPTLMYNTKSNYEQIGMALSTRGIGLLFGSLIGGILSDRYKSLRSLFIMLSLIIGAITTLIIPWCINIIILTIILFIAGFSHGFLTTKTKHEIQQKRPLRA
ncbi:Sodium-dependent glucose transporter 1, variant 2 [Schistosoma haematobium]|uniref:Sodium-dependent glucose transporter 1, variant 2 n=1 Tax=Schistosoma haematobium TaxID=6185 RepID=A0A922M029_SCHHA|nr:Sodium-dependent glucose transporter 1, variant 2 [Schistosoma haematobium]KAH9596968.1 Sodium-dependent glucose transporter 1, variant 2 [Schistosoma haematobium]